MSEKAGTRYALLGMLSEAPMSGYEIRQRLEQGTANFWSESYGQIYPQLKELSAAGLIRKIASEQKDGRPERRLYEISDEGRQELRQWLRREAEIRPVRNELLLKLYFAAEMDTETIRWHIAQHAKAQRKRLERLDDLKQMIRTLPITPEKKIGWLLTLSYGRHATRAALDWAEEASIELA